MFESAGYAHWCCRAFRYRCRPVRWLKPGPAAGEQDFIGVPVARPLGPTGKGVDVGVIDGGFLPQHPAFAGQVAIRWPTEWPSTAEAAHENAW